jgi:hypothetical protein
MNFFGIAVRAGVEEEPLRGSVAQRILQSEGRHVFLRSGCAATPR